MNWLVIGANGMLGTDFNILRERRIAATGVDIDVLDITDRSAVARYVASAFPQVIVNCAAFTRVDDCETKERLATAVNGEAVRHLAAAADSAGALLVQISTDFVFDGSKQRPYEVDDAPSPLSAYGRSKLAGEEAASSAAKHAIVRTSWLFGTNGWNFVEAIRKQVASGNTSLRVVDDQVGCPTYTPHLVDAIIRIAQSVSDDPSKSGIYHYSDQPPCSWFDFAVEIVRQLGAGESVAVNPVSTSEFPRPAVRPAYSVMSTERYRAVTGAEPASWVDGLAEYLKKTEQ